MPLRLKHLALVLAELGQLQARNQHLRERPPGTVLEVDLRDEHGLLQWDTVAFPSALAIRLHEQGRFHEIDARRLITVYRRLLKDQLLSQQRRSTDPEKVRVSDFGQRLLALSQLPPA